MKLNTQFYQDKHKKKQINKGKKIAEYIENFSNQEYEKHFSKDVTTEEIRHLSTICQNIINWYPFRENSSILEVGGNLGEITGVLCKKANKVVTLENQPDKATIISKRYENQDNLEIILGEWEDITLTEKFDYITLIGSLPYIAKANHMTSQEMIDELSKNLKEDGILLIAVDNQFGIRYFVGNPENHLNKKFVGLLNYNNEEDKIETYTKQKLQKMLEQTGFSYQNFYYPLPDYRMPNVIFSDKEPPKYNSVDKYMPYPKEKSDILMNEIDLFREILKNDDSLFSFFANAYLVEASKKENEQKYSYVSYNNLRKPEYRLMTKIGTEYVEKEPVDDKALLHYEQIKKNIEILKQKQILTLDYVENGKIRSKYVQQQYLLSNVLTQKLEQGKDEEFENIIQEYIQILRKDTYPMQNIQDTIFAEYDISITKPEILKDLHFAKDGLWDMTFKNCFYLENEFYFFDQEWYSSNLPVEYILYRSLIYTISLRRYVNIEKLIKKYQLAQYRDIFEQLDMKMQEKIREDSIWQYYSQNHNFDIDSTKQELENEKIRGIAKEGAIQNLQKELQLKEEALENASLKNRIKRLLGGK